MSGSNGFTYSSYQNAIVTQIPSFTSDPNFSTILPVAISYAELSIQRDLDFLAYHGLLSLGNTTSGNNLIPVPSGVIVTEAVYAGASNIPLIATSQDYIRSVYGGVSGYPEYFCPIGAASGATWTPAVQILLGPTPNSAVPLTGYVTQRQAPLSASNPTTFISLNLPDLFWAASMIFFAGYNRNFGAQSDDPRQAISWSAEYQRLLKGADQEEIRKKFMNQGASAKMPAEPVGAQHA
jgi:hypothetical protein